MTHAVTAHVVLYCRDTDKRTSKYRGVSWNSAGSKWVAVLWDRGLKRARHIGTFDSELDAARAYDQAARQLIGPSARLNFRLGTFVIVDRS